MRIISWLLLMPRLRTTDPPASCIYDKQRNESRPSFPFFHRRHPPLPLRKPQSHIRHLTPFISRVNFPGCGHTHNVNLIVSVSQGLLGLSEQWRKMLNKYITPLYQIYQLCVREAAFWNVVVWVINPPISVFRSSPKKRSSEMNITPDINNQLKSIDFFRSMFI